MNEFQFQTNVCVVVVPHRAVAVPNTTTESEQMPASICFEFFLKGKAVRTSWAIAISREKK